MLVCDIWALSRENLSSGFAKHKGADQPALPRNLISAFVIRVLQSIISKLAVNKTSNFYLVSVAEETGFSSLCRKPQRRGIRFPKMWYVRPAKAQTSLRLRAV